MARLSKSGDMFPLLPLDLDRPRFFQRAGSPVLILSLHRRTVPAPLRIPGPLTDGRKANGKRGRSTWRKRTIEERDLLSPVKTETVTLFKFKNNSVT